MKVLKITQFGNEVLRKPAVKIPINTIRSEEIQSLVKNMQKLLIGKKLGIGLAAPQVGEPVAVAIIELQKTPLRNDAEELSLVIINPKIIKYFGKKYQSWEGCISSGAGKAGLFAMVPRYKKLELEYTDEKAQKHTRVFSGLAAHVIQHEVDHLNGVLFVDKVTDTHTFMTYNEYKKMKQKGTK